MANSTEPIVVQIINEGAATATSAVGGSKPSGSSGGGIASALGGVAKLGGMAAVVIEVLGMVKDAISTVLQPLKSVVMVVLKLLAQILRPVADVLIVVLIPIIQMLKPIIKVFNDIIKPFRLAAYKLMSAAMGTSDLVQKGELLKSATSAMFEGFIYGVLGIVKELIKINIGYLIDIIKNMIIGPLIDIFKTIIPDWIVEDKVFDDAKTKIFDGLDDAKTTIGDALDKSLDVLSKNGIKKYDDLLAKFTDEIDWKTPEDILAAKMSMLMSNAANKAAGNEISVRGPTSGMVSATKRAEAYQQANNYDNLELFNRLMKNQGGAKGIMAEYRGA